MTKQELIENIKQFNIENYYSEDTTGINENSAVLIITDNQRNHQMMEKKYMLQLSLIFIKLSMT